VDLVLELVVEVDFVLGAFAMRGHDLGVRVALVAERAGGALAVLETDELVDLVGLELVCEL